MKYNINRGITLVILFLIMVMLLLPGNLLTQQNAIRSGIATAVTLVEPPGDGSGGDDSGDDISGGDDIGGDDGGSNGDTLGDDHSNGGSTIEIPPPVYDDERYPNIADITYPPEVGIHERIEITARVTDTDGLNKVYLNYTDVNRVFWSVQMTFDTKGLWKYTIPGQPINGLVSFYIWAIDINNFANNTILYYVIVTENEPPIIKDIQYSKQVQINKDIVISALISDETGIGEVILNYTDVYKKHHSLLMELEDPGRIEVNCYITIPGQAVSGKLEFYIIAMDENFNRNQTDSFLIEIYSEIVAVGPPVIENISIPEKVLVNEPLKVKVKIHDDANVNGVFLVYTDVNVQYFNMSMVSSGDKNYTYNIPAQSKTGLIILYINVANTNGTWTSTMNFSIDIYEEIVDIFRPYVISAMPQNNSYGVSVDTDVSFVFNESMNISSVNSAILINTAIDYITTWSNYNRTLRLEFLEQCNYNRTYIITINTSARDLAGNMLVQPCQLVFTTAVPMTTNDRDHDGMDDIWEMKFGLNPNDPADALWDKDDDSLINYDEYRYGTNPTKKDTDGDGYSDYIEILEGTDPLDPASHPTDDDYDTDNDGLPDDWELEHFGHLNYSGNEDTDNDGYTNLEEYIGGSDPNNAGEVPSGNNNGINIVIIPERPVYTTGQAVRFSVMNNGSIIIKGSVKVQIINDRGEIVKILEITSENSTFKPGHVLPVVWTQFSDSNIIVGPGLYYAKVLILEYSNFTEFAIIKPSKQMYDWLGITDEHYLMLIDRALNNNKIGASADVLTSGFNIFYFLSKLQLRLLSSSINKLQITISGELNHSTIIILNIDKYNFALPTDNNTRLVISFDGVVIKNAGLEDVLNSTGDEAVYFIGVGTAGMQLILYVPHFSEHVLTLEKIEVSGGQPAKDAGLPWLNIVIIIIVLVCIVIIIGVFGYSRSTKLKQDKFYRNYNIDNGIVMVRVPPGGDAGKSKDQDDEWSKYYSGK